MPHIPLTHTSTLPSLVSAPPTRRTLPLPKHWFEPAKVCMNSIIHAGMWDGDEIMSLSLAIIMCYTCMQNLACCVMTIWTWDRMYRDILFNLNKTDAKQLQRFALAFTTALCILMRISFQTGTYNYGMSFVCSQKRTQFSSVHFDLLTQEMLHLQYIAKGKFFFLRCTTLQQKNQRLQGIWTQDRAWARHWRLSLYQYTTATFNSLSEKNNGNWRRI